MKLAKVLAAAVIAVSLHDAASAETIDFDSVTLDINGQFVVSTYVEGSVSITRLAGLTVVEDQAPNGTNALVGYDSVAGAQWSATFGSTLNSVSIDLGDFGGDADTIFLTAFNASNGQIGTISQDLVSGFSGMVTLNLTLADIKSIRFGISSGDGIYADNLVFSPVPIPAMLPIFAAAVGFLGFVTWRLHRRPLAAV